jgi:HEAT repeat protein
MKQEKEAVFKFVVAFWMAMVISSPLYGYLPGEEAAAQEEALRNFYVGVLEAQGIPVEVSSLKTSLCHSDSTVRTGAVFLLAYFGERSAVPDMKGLLTDPRPLVRVVTAQSLLKLGDESGFETILRESRNADPSVRLASVHTAGLFAKLPGRKAQAVQLLTQASSLREL